jgi:hypothetical protein
MNPRGGTVYVTGDVADYEADQSYGTVAYSVSRGAMKWAETYSNDGFALAAAISPDGHTLYVTGESGSDPDTIAYRA